MTQRPFLAVLLDTQALTPNQKTLCKSPCWVICLLTTVPMLAEHDMHTSSSCYADCHDHSIWNQGSSCGLDVVGELQYTGHQLLTWLAGLYIV